MKENDSNCKESILAWVDSQHGSSGLFLLHLTERLQVFYGIRDILGVGRLM
jgi:hypothetical protein